MILSVAICAHISREEMAWSLAEQLDCPISMDDGSSDSDRNHDETLRLAAQTPSDWIIAMEDDAQPVPGFREQACMALAVCPDPIASLYFGWIQEPDSGFMSAFDEQDPHWFRLTALANTVCLAIHRDFWPPFLDALEGCTETTSDGKYEHAALSLGQKTFAYCYPSLVEHADGRTVHYTGADHVPRRAYKVGTRPAWSALHWNRGLE
jgi:hypothetical protein